MPKHNTYEQDENISDNDIILGSDADDNLKTKNYRIGKLKDYFISFVETIVGPQGPQGPPGESASVNYKVYTALLTQTGTNAPVATVLENTLDTEVIWEYIATGNYRSNIIPTLEDTHTAVFLQTVIVDGENNLIQYSILNDFGVKTVQLLTKSTSSPFGKNGVLYKTPIEIRVYN